MKLRDYQEAAVDAAKEWIKKCIEPAVLELATGAGKSIIVAELAKWLNNASGKKVLCIAPSKELVEQNRAKYLQTGNPASLLCASAGKIDLRHDVIFGSPQTIKNNLKKFGDRFAAVVIDECHGITNTVQHIVDEMRKNNPKLRVIGLTATPYRMNSGYIYRYDEDGNPVPETQTKEPYFDRLLYRVDAPFLIENGYLTRPHADPEHIESYDTSFLTLDKMGKFDARGVEQAFEGKGRKTAAIVADIIDKSAFRHGVIIFAATVQHAQEVMDSLPKERSAIVHGGTGKSERERIIADFQDMKIKYLVNVAILTTGFDAPHVDVVAILRATESVGLLQQIVGRGLRLLRPDMAGDLYAIAHSSKPDCLVLDYAENIERHCPDGDIFNPLIKAGFTGSEESTVLAACPDCHTQNIFSGRKNPEQFEIDENGYFIDLSGHRILTDDDLPMPAHFGRRCYGRSIVKGLSDRCSYRWSCKKCHECEHENDIAARYCEQCKSELVDPNTKLVLEFTKMKKDPYRATTDKVLSWRCQEWQTQNGNITLRVDYSTEFASFAIWYRPQGRSSKDQAQWAGLCMACGVSADSAEQFMEFVNSFEISMPKTITAQKNRNTGFYEVLAHNQPEDRLENEIPRLA